MKRFYRAVGNLVAFDIDNFDFKGEDPFILFKRLGFGIFSCDIIELANFSLNIPKYKLHAPFSSAPQFVDCSSFVKWLYAKKGIWLPRRSINQRAFGEEVDFNYITEGDLIFSENLVAGFNYTGKNNEDRVGHVGIIVGKEDQYYVIHATYKDGTVGYCSIEEFISKEKFRGVRRYFPKGHKIITLEIPQKLEIETDLDVMSHIFISTRI